MELESLLYWHKVFTARAQARSFKCTVVPSIHCHRQVPRLSTYAATELVFQLASFKALRADDPLGLNI